MEFMEFRKNYEGSGDPGDIQRPIPISGVLKKNRQRFTSDSGFSKRTIKDSGVLFRAP